MSAEVTLREVDLDGVVDTRGIRYLGKATRGDDGRWTCLADVGGRLCLVEVKLTPTPRIDVDSPAAALAEAHASASPSPSARRVFVCAYCNARPQTFPRTCCAVGAEIDAAMIRVNEEAKLTTEWYARVAAHAWSAEILTGDSKDWAVLKKGSVLVACMKKEHAGEIAEAMNRAEIPTKP
jgi:hypothetical protein